MKIPFAVMLLGLAACKSPQAHSEASVAEAIAAREETLVVIAGGFSSCPDDFLLDKAMRAGKTAEMYHLFFQHKLHSLSQAKLGSLPAVFSICYTGPDNLASHYTQSISGRYAWNLADLQKDSPGVKSFAIPQGLPLKDVGFLSYIKGELRDYLQSRKSAGVTVRMYLIGHSYGGFTSIQLADEFSEQLAGLFTIDPISMLNCQAKDMATKVYSTVSMQHPGCKSAPNDPYSKQSIARILEDVHKSGGRKWWYHTYQNAFPWLHSGPIRSQSGSSPTTQLFTLRDFKSAFVDGDYHSQMGRSEAVWSLISAQLHQK